ncbi:hypothetical protein H696_05226 [Fonticula alba]|uniref:NOL1/NOP2/Sun domain family member 4 n=1 Tax=Fonticula alba TaxID=691883 RepID=A0A058Z2Z4_FONAL|nr:hypothetical protein H696_05226 [Fonticula alba]KCV68308.1 hypothetical protein H696_05226 [Fonticula alba]|eukprot:XP_009497362.1 hypothetical protein H696_05226 [Fonticula alba]
MPPKHYRQFLDYHDNEYGPQRWRTRLLPALKRTPEHVAMVNWHADPAAVCAALRRSPESYADAEDPEKLLFVQSPYIGSLCALVPASGSAPGAGGDPFPPPMADRAGQATYYILNVASLLCIDALDIRPGQKVLDLCAAPGGKSVAIAQRLWRSHHAGEAGAGPEAGPGPAGPVCFDLGAEARDAIDADADGLLVLNEPAAPRRARLERTVEAFMPRQYRASVRVLSLNATRTESLPPAHHGLYDRVLVDAPCSTDRHVARAPDTASPAVSNSAAGPWSPSGMAQTAGRQLSLVLAAIAAARAPEDGLPGGRVVYSTCALSVRENDWVVAQALQQSRSRHPVRPVDPRTFGFRIGRPTRFGWLILPDQPATAWQPGQPGERGATEGHVSGDGLPPGMAPNAPGHNQGPIFIAVLERIPSPGGAASSKPSGLVADEGDSDSD